MSGDKRGVEARRAEFFRNVFERPRRVEVLRGEPYDFAARFGKLNALLHRGFDVACFCVRHRLHDDVVVPADFHVAHAYFARGRADAVKSGYAIISHV